ncbi:MAG: hypothetical protein AAFR66_25235, partial [Bacteroidota bacterium]
MRKRIECNHLAFKCSEKQLAVPTRKSYVKDRRNVGKDILGKQFRIRVLEKRSSGSYNHSELFS